LFAASLAACVAYHVASHCTVHNSVVIAPEIEVDVR
jgi:hypothetical protein